MNGFHRFSRRLSTVLLVSLGAGVAQAQLNDTGQDKCYDGTNLVTCTNANTGDGAAYPRQDGRFGRDAAATAGVLPKTGGGAAGFGFTPLAADGSEIALTGNPPVPSATPTCIRDNHANLIWEVKTDDNGLRDKDWTYTWYDPTAADPGTPDGGVGQNSDNCFNPARCDTEKFMADVNAAGLCGYNTGWRLPTRRELLSIVHNGVLKPTIDVPTIDVNYFPNTIGSPLSGWYWNANTYARLPTSAWFVDFSFGFASADDKNNDRRIRLVRSGPPFPNFIDNSDGTVTDAETGLMWDKCSWGQTWTGAPPNTNTCGGSAIPHNWANALTMAVTANTDNHRGYNDWRLPNKNELESLVDLTKSTGPTIDTTVFPNTTTSSSYLSSTAYTNFPTHVWLVTFLNGETGTDDMIAGHHVRLVRSGQSFDPSDLLGSLITANASPAGGGTVSCAPNPVSSGGTSTCTATPNAGYSFAGWAGDCTVTGGNCEFTDVTAPKSVTAIFYVPGGGGGVPAVGLWGLGLLAGLLAGIGGFQLRRGRRVRR